MEKKKIVLADLKPDRLMDAEDIQKNTCEKIRKDVNDYLARQCSKKINRLQKCTKCNIEHKEWPVINTPMDAKFLNTAFDGVNSKLNLSASDNFVMDLHWEAGLGDVSGPGSVAKWVPAFVSKCERWVESPFGNANWISLYYDAKHENNRDIYFRYNFYLNSTFDPSQFFLEMDFYADNSVHEIYVNQVKQSVYHSNILPQAVQTEEYSHTGYFADKQVHIKLSNDWKSCDNEIIVHIKSGAPYAGFLAQNSTNCYTAKLPKITPTIYITWGDSKCDCIETDDTEIMCITVCNSYSNIILKNFTIGRIRVVNENGSEVALLPDGTPSVGLHPIGPYCFGDIAACNPKMNNCISREFVLINRGAKSGKYRILLEGICFEACAGFSLNDCFEYIACYS